MCPEGGNPGENGFLPVDRGRERGPGMRTLSKSKLMAFRQCPKRLWLEVNRPELRQESAETQARFAIGYRVGDVARRLYDPEGRGALIDIKREGFEEALRRSTALLGALNPIFEAGFSADGAMAFSDVMLPVRHERGDGWRMVEVKSSTSVKDYHVQDVAIQCFIARRAGVPLLNVALAHIDSSWTYPGEDDYRGLLLEEDLTKEAFELNDQVRELIGGAQAALSQNKEPKIQTGRHCSDPFECGFIEYCRSKEPQPVHPVTWLPRIQSKALIAAIDGNGISEMADISDDLLNATQLRVKACTLSGTPYLDLEGAKNDLSRYSLPVCFLDLETTQFAVPVWAGTRPYQQIPFQFSMHRLSEDGVLTHHMHLDLSGQNPSEGIARALTVTCGSAEPVFVYNIGFEAARIRELAAQFPRLQRPLLALADRLVDLLPIARGRYYHPSQQGSWSIKAVLPAIFPDLRYDDLEEIQDGGMAMSAYLEAIDRATTPQRKAEIQRALEAYCRLDTYGLVRIWQFFAGRSDLRL